MRGTMTVGQSRLRKAAIAAVVVFAGIVALIIGFILFEPFGHGHDHDERVYRANMNTALRDLFMAQESFYIDSARYSATIPPMTNPPSADITLTMVQVTATGWSASARHSLSDQTCFIFSGDVAPPVTGAVEGEPKCLAGGDRPGP
jgi:hypothetical protein